MRHFFRQGAWFILAIAWLAGCSTPQTRFYKSYPRYAGEPNQHKRLISASPDHIFKILTNPGAFTQLVPEYTRVAFDSETFKVGTKLTIHIDHLLKFTWHTQVREMVPDQQIRLEFLDGLFKGGTEIWELESEDDKTLVLQTIIVQPKGWIRNFIWNFKARKRHNVMVEKFLDNLKKVTESPQRAGDGNSVNG